MIQEKRTQVITNYLVVGEGSVVASRSILITNMKY